MAGGAVNNVSFEALDQFSRDMDSFKTQAETALKTLQDVANTKLKVGEGDVQGQISTGYGNLLSQDAVTGYGQAIEQLGTTKKLIDDTIKAWKDGEDAAHGNFAGQ